MEDKNQGEEQEVNKTDSEPQQDVSSGLSGATEPLQASEIRATESLTM